MRTATCTNGPLPELGLLVFAYTEFGAAQVPLTDAGSKPTLARAHMTLPFASLCFSKRPCVLLLGQVFGFRSLIACICAMISPPAMSTYASCAE